MAIPFNVEQDTQNDEVALQQLLGELCQTLRQIRLMQFRNQSASAYILRPRAALNSSIEVSTSTLDFEHRYPDIGVRVALSLAPFLWQNDLVTSAPNATASGEHSRRTPSGSEPLCYEDTEPVKVSVSVEVRNRECPKQEQPVQPVPKESCSGPRRLLSKLVPVPFGGPIWTAVICVVGWHLLRAR